MCQRCDNNAVVKKWQVWVTIGITILLFTLSQVFLYGQFTGKVEEHIKKSERFITKEEIVPRLERIEKNVDNLVNELIKKGINN